MKRKRRKIRKPSVPRPEAIAKQEIFAMAKRLGIGREYRRIPESAKAIMYGKPCLPPIVKLDHSLRDNADIEAAVEGIRYGLKHVQILIGWMDDTPMSLASVYSSLAHLHLFLPAFVKGNPTHEAALRCLEVVNKVVQYGIPVAGKALENTVISNLLPLQRFDQRLYGARLMKATTRANKVRMEIRIFCEPARRVQIEIDGISRPAFQCGGILRPDVIDWTKWNPHELDMDGPNQPCPVFVQSHAIINLHERLGIPQQLNEPFIMMFHSLMEPNIVVRQDNGTILVECKSAIGRLGYFVVRFLGDKFLVSTFLFITMKGTPESQKLYARLHVRRHTVETMKLDRLETYMLGDIGRDRELVAVLTDCGCEHLLKMTDRLPFQHRVLMRDARRIRRILGWAAPKSEEDEPTMEQMETTFDEMRAWIAKTQQTPGVMSRMLSKISDILPDEMLPNKGRQPKSSNKGSMQKE